MLKFKLKYSVLVMPLYPCVIYTINKQLQDNQSPRRSEDCQKLGPVACPKFVSINNDLTFEGMFISHHVCDVTFDWLQSSGFIVHVNYKRRLISLVLPNVGESRMTILSPERLIHEDDWHLSHSLVTKTASVQVQERSPDI